MDALVHADACRSLGNAEQGGCRNWMERERRHMREERQALLIEWGDLRDDLRRLLEEVQRFHKTKEEGWEDTGMSGGIHLPITKDELAESCVGAVAGRVTYKISADIIARLKDYSTTYYDQRLQEALFRDEI